MKVVLAENKHIDRAAELLHEEWYDSLSEAKEQLNLKINKRECFVAVEGEQVLGVLMYARDYSHYANYCEDIVVSRAHRKKGIAVELMKKFIEVSGKEQIDKQKLVLSSTDVTNEASIKMHEKAGFENLGTIKKLHFGKDEIFFGYKLR